MWDQQEILCGPWQLKQQENGRKEVKGWTRQDQSFPSQWTIEAAYLCFWTIIYPLGGLGLRLRWKSQLIRFILIFFFISSYKIWSKGEKWQYKLLHRRPFCMCNAFLSLGASTDWSQREIFTFSSFLALCCEGGDMTPQLEGLYIPPFTGKACKVQKLLCGSGHR